MIKSFFVLLFSLLVINSFSQQADSINVNKSNQGKVSSIIDIQDLVKDGFNYWEEEFSGHWAGIFVGLNGFANKDYSMYTDGDFGFLDNDILKSHTLQLNLFQYSKGLQANRNTIGLVTGLGLDIQGHRLENNTTIEKNSNGTIYPQTLVFEDNQKSKLSSVYLNVPFILEFQVPFKHYANRLYLSGGMIWSKRLSTHTKIKYRVDNQKQKLKTPDSYSIPEYKCSATIRMGYRWVNVFASYDLIPLFEKDKGPVLFPYTIGLCLLQF